MDRAARIESRSFSKTWVVLTAGLLASGSCSGEDSATATICDGSNAIRFSFRNIGGGSVLPGSQVLGENGSNFLIVDGQCHFWALENEYSDVRAGNLTDSQENSLSTALRLSSWRELRGDYTDSLCDGPTREYRFAGSKIAVYSACGGGSSPVSWLLNPALSQLQAIYDNGTPIDGPVRVVLVSEPADAFWPTWWIDNSVRWPSTTDPKSIALTYDQASNYQRGSSVLVMPSDADALRSARRSFVEKNGPQITGGLLPVLGPMDERYDCFARDSISLEDALGLLNLD